MRVKIIGAGSIGNHLAHAARVLGWSVDLVDLDSAALDRTRTQIYPGRYGRWDEGVGLFACDAAPKGGYDLICIGTPPDSHMKLALQALDEKPSAILIEKPVCTPALENADDLVSRAQATGCRLFVGYDHVVGVAAMRFCELIDEGIVGRPQTLDVEFREHWGAIFAVHPWLNGPSDSYLAFWQRGGGAASEHSHAFNLWQHFARHLKMGRVTEVTATLDYVEQDGMSYDQLCLANLTTEAGLTGRVAQDLITKPPRKWARLQGTDGFIEWECGYERNRDAVIFSCATDETKVETFAKNRPDDFILELQHIAAVMKGDLERSTLAIEHGLETMLVTAAAHKSSQSGRAIAVDWNKGYSTAALEP